MSEKLKSKIKSNQEIKNLLSEFYAEFQKAIKKTDNNFFNSEHGFSFYEGLEVSHTQEMNQASYDLVKQAEKLLGARYGDEKELSDLIRNQAFVAFKAKNNEKDFIKITIDKILEILDQDFEVYLPNHIVHIEKDVPPLKIGDVRIISLIDMEKEIKSAFKPNKNVKILFEHDKGEMFIDFKDGKISLPSATNMWAVKTCTNRTYIKEEALWKIGVALSLLRLSSQLWDNRIPKRGEIEASSISKDENIMRNGLVRNGESFSGGGESFSGIYILDKKIAKDLNKKKQQNLFDQIFEFSSGQLAEQVFNALGWLSKGRQENDRAAKLLDFFTAIETLLTRQDKNSPVIDTISRHASVILAKTIKNRESIAKELKALYSYRSQTVHRGKRNTSKSDVIKAELYAEMLLYVVMKECKLNSSHEDFCSKLAKASYGSKWEK